MKQRTYAEEQYRLALSMIREADNWAETDPSFSSYTWESLHEQVEDSYFIAAVKSRTMASKRGRYGVDFWKYTYGRIIWGNGRIPIAMKIKAHVMNYFIPF